MPPFLAQVQVDWLDVIGRFGIPVAALIGIGLFFVYRVWPFIASSVEKQREDRIRERELFKASLDGLTEAILVGQQDRAKEREMFLREVAKQRRSLEKLVASQEKIATIISAIDEKVAASTKRAE